MDFISLTNMFGVSLAVTIVAELAVVFIFGLRSLKALCLVILVNVLTNPPAVLLYWLGRQYLPDIPWLIQQLAIEAAVVAAETYIFCSFAKLPRWRIKNPAVLAAAANIGSWLFGLLVM